MLGAIFSFRGRLNRLQYFAASAGLGTAFLVIALLVAGTAMAALRGNDPASLARAAGPSLLFLVVLMPIYFWISFSLQARRFRHIGWDPVFVIPGWIGLNIVDRLMVMGAPQLGVFGGIGWLGVAASVFFGGSLLFWPGRKAFDIASVFDDVPPADAPPPPMRPAPAPAAAAWRATPAPSGFGRRGL